MNLLCYGDNLGVLRRHIADESVDLIYVDPPFGFHAGDNAAFAERGGTPAPVRIHTFDDRWGWNESAAGAYEEVMQAGGHIMTAMRAFWRFLGDTDMLAYLATLALRLVEMRRVLKPTGSIYLHCDSTSSHYVKLLMDVVFGAAGFRNEIIWQRNAGSANPPSNRFGDSTETILFYANSAANIFHPQFAGGHGQLKGHAIQNVWDSFETTGAPAIEPLGYPTEKPEALLERIIRASSNDDAVVLDPFCGGGTTLAVAQRLNRRWIGIDITQFAIGLTRHRLRGVFGDDIDQTYRIIGGPATMEDVETLAASDERQFRWWALGLFGARPDDGRTSTDTVVHGRIHFRDGTSARQGVISVKAGKLRVPDVEEMRRVVDREQAAMGVLVTLNEPAKAVRAKAGLYPRLQIMTAAQLLAGERPVVPSR